MENDTVRSMGESTLVDVWINGKMRSVCVSRGAIESFLQLPPQAAAEMSEDDRREFVRTHLGIVVATAKDRLAGSNAGNESILIDSGQLGRKTEGGFIERRRGGGDRRKGDRRKGGSGPVDRRGGDRRA
jgi:ABC-type phosphonate transport system ATPase subunit